jgi:hypothetical protein
MSFLSTIPYKKALFHFFFSKKPYSNYYEHLKKIRQIGSVVPIEKSTFSFSRIFNFPDNFSNFFSHENLIRTITNIQKKRISQIGSAVLK